MQRYLHKLLRIYPDRNTAGADLHYWMIPLLDAGHLG
jgi:hypothetical protein